MDGVRISRQNVWMFDILGYTEDIPAWFVLCLIMVAVLVVSVKDVYLSRKKFSISNRDDVKISVEVGKGIGARVIHAKEPALSLRYIRTACN